MYLFSVNAYVYIPMMLLMVKNCYEFSKMGIQAMGFLLGIFSFSILKMLKFLINFIFSDFSHF